jgi:AcrR family transcriptional regulator
MKEVALLPKLSRREREKLAKKREILDAACKVFAIKGYYGATLEEIAEEAEFSKAAIYLYFKSKEDLFIEILEMGMNAIFEEFNEMLPQISDMRDKLKELVRIQLSFVEKNKDFFKIYWEERLYLEKTFDRDFRQNKLQIFEYMKTLIKAGQNANVLRTDFTVDDLTGILFGQIFGTTWSWINYQPNEPLADKSNVIMDIFLNGAGI